MVAGAAACTSSPTYPDAAPASAKATASAGPTPKQRTAVWRLSLPPHPPTINQLVKCSLLPFPGPLFDIYHATGCWSLYWRHAEACDCEFSFISGTDPAPPYHGVVMFNQINGPIHVVKVPLSAKPRLLALRPPYLCVGYLGDHRTSVFDIRNGQFVRRPLTVCTVSRR